jgi:glycosyltransferase involved in cell wall biosynthesis
MPSVLFVSKPVDPPINDGSKHVVMTLASHLRRYEPRVMTTHHVRDVGPGIRAEAIYAAASHYAPSLLNNVRAARHLAFHGDASLWNFVFAPNHRSSQMGRWLRSWRHIPVVQTIASRPRHFDDSAKLLFGDVIAAQSRYTRNRLQKAWGKDGQGAGKCPKIEVIYPPLGPIRVPTLDETTAVRRSLNVGLDVPILLYPGDLEVSHGARVVKAAAVVIAERHPTAVVVFAYRDKTAATALAANDLRRDLSPDRVRFVREAPDILALVRTSAAVLFPVDDLFGKVDMPIILLSAMALGTPVVTYAIGPLAELDGAEITRIGDPLALADSAVALIDDHDRRHRCTETQHRTIERHHDATRIAAAYETIYDDLLARAANRGRP